MAPRVKSYKEFLSTSQVWFGGQRAERKMTGSSMSSWGVALASKSPGCRPRGGAVPVDLYGHNPTEVAQYKTWTGFAFSIVVFLVVFISCAYVVYEYVTLPYDLAQSEVAYDPELLVEPEGLVEMPDVAVQVASNDKKAFNIDELSDVVDILFYQNYIFGDGEGGSCPGEYDGKRCKKRVRIPSEICRFGSNRGNDTRIEAFCPMWGYLTEEFKNDRLDIQFVPTKTRENATVPALKGNFLDPEYAFLEAEVLVNLTGLKVRGSELQFDMDTFFGGSITYVVAFHRHDISEIGINDQVQHVFERWVESLDVMEYLNSKIDIPLTHRTIDKGNFIVDFAFLEQSYQDVIMGPVVTKIDDSRHIPSLYAVQNSTGNIPKIFDFETKTAQNVSVPETIQLSKALFHVARKTHQIQMTPPSTIFDILGTVGGFLSLFSLMIGWPAVIINQLYYGRALKRARETGAIPDHYLEEDGTVRVDKANEVVQHLMGMDDLPRSTTSNMKTIPESGEGTSTSTVQDME